MTDKEFDDGLKAVMGEKFHDETEEKPIAKPVAKPTAKKKATASKAAPKEEKPVESLWEPEMPKPDFMDKLKQTAKDVCLYALISTVLFWWQQTGRLDEKTSWYALLICVGMVFFSIGKNWKGWFE